MHPDTHSDTHKHTHRHKLTRTETRREAHAGNTPSPAPDGWWVHPSKQAKVGVVTICEVSLEVLLLKLMSVQSANTRVYVLGRIVCVS